MTTDATFDFQSFPILETARLRLRQIVPEDAAAWLAVNNHPEVIRYLIDFEHGTTNLAEMREIIQWTLDIFSQRSGIRWGITLKADSTLIGSCGFHLYSRHHRCAEIGYELHHAFWRRGLMREAVTAMLNFGFARLNLHRVEATVTVGNQASAGLLHALGFTQEGTWRDKYFSRGQFYDVWQFGLLEGEFRNMA